MSGAGRISLKHHVPYAGIPDSGQMIGTLARDYDEPVRLAIQKSKVLATVAIDHHHSVQSQVRLVY
jgi:hypothetical protein